MNIPKKINIFGLNYKIFHISLAPNILGYCDNTEKKIFLCKDKHNTPEELLHTLIHEIGHAVFHRTSIYQGLDHSSEEIIVNNFATAILENLTIFNVLYIEQDSTPALIL